MVNPAIIKTALQAATAFAQSETGQQTIKAGTQAVVKRAPGAIRQGGEVLAGLAKKRDDRKSEAQNRDPAAPAPRMAFRPSMLAGGFNLMPPVILAKKALGTHAGARHISSIANATANAFEKHSPVIEQLGTERLQAAFSSKGTPPSRLTRNRSMTPEELHAPEPSSEPTPHAQDPAFIRG